ncbi:ABC transporter permease [Plantibacter sp. Mn2098]|uniref:ABC transporter permease n=1 Tax=Plantibacter sp. Mn2098 TaxID=3395266 RepID=UPI003BC16B0A
MNWVIDNWSMIWGLTLTHIGLSIPPIILGFAISLPLGWLAHRYRLTRGALLTISGILYAIPSLPLFVIMPSIIGTQILDPANVVVALTIYAIALLVRTIADALDAVDAGTRQSAQAVGFSPWQRFWRVEFPLAGPLMLAGVRVVSASTISLLSVGALVGVTNLGYLFTDGYARQFPTEIITGIVGTVLIAIVFDIILVVLGRVVMPWTRISSKRAIRRRREAAMA